MVGQWMCCPKKQFSQPVNSQTTVNCAGCGAFFHKSCAEIKPRRKSDKSVFVVCCGEIPTTKRSRKGTDKGPTGSSASPSEQLSEDSDVDLMPLKTPKCTVEQKTSDPLVEMNSSEDHTTELQPGKIRTLDQLFDKLESRDKKRTENLQSQYNGLKSSLDSLTNTVNQSIAAQDAKIAEIGKKVDSLAESQDPLIVKFTAVAELNEQTYRASNIIIHNAPEGSPEMDLALIKDLVDQIGGIDKKNLVVRRLGSAGEGKTRVMIVRFSSNTDANKFYEQKTKILSKFKISRDRTMDERKLIKKLADEIDHHNTNHPDDRLVMRWRNGVPQKISEKSLRKKN